MPVKDEVWVIEDDAILTVQDGKSGRPKRGGGRAARRPSPVGEPAIQVAVRKATGGSHRPAVAGALSLFVCGAGQAYNGQTQMGALCFVIEAALITFHWSATAMWGFLREMGTLFEFTEESMLITVAAMDAFLLLFVLFNVAQAYGRASADHGNPGGSTPVAVPIVASAVLPGLGQLINGQLGKSLAFLFVILSGGLVAASPRLLPYGEYFYRIDLMGRLSEYSTQIMAGIICLAGALWIVSVYDAYLVARYRNR